MASTEKKSHRTVSPKSLANLRPFKKGKEWTGNAGGRPKSRLQSEVYRAELAKENKAGETNAELIAKQMVALDELAERIAKGRKRVKK